MVGVSTLQLVDFDLSYLLSHTKTLKIIVSTSLLSLTTKRIM